MHWKSSSVTTDPNTTPNSSKLIDLVIIIELTRANFMPRLSNFLRNSTIHFRMFLDLKHVSWESRFRWYACNKLYRIYMLQLQRNWSTLWPAQQRKHDSQKHVININTCENWWSNFSKSLRIVALKLLKLTKFASPNQSITLILYGVGQVRCDLQIFWTSLLNINREVYEYIYLFYFLVYFDYITRTSS